MLRLALESQGYSVIEARDQAEAMRELRQSEADLILSDLRLPEGDGLGVLRSAKELDPEIPVIVMTAYGNVANAVECMRRGAYDYIEKNRPDVDAYEAITEKVDQALLRRRHDIRTVDLWESLKGGN